MNDYININLSRRRFLKLSAAGMGSVLLNSFIPRFSFAAGAGTGKVLFLLNLEGGMDDKFAFPYTNGSLAAAIATRRPTIQIAPSAALDLNGTYGLHQNWGDAFRQLHLRDGKLKLISCAGIPNNTRSHNDDMGIMSVGARNAPPNERTGFLGRLINSNNLSSYQVFGINSGTRLDYYGANNPPIVLETLAGYTRRGREADFGEADAILSEQISRQLLQLPTQVSQEELSVKNTLKLMYDSLGQVKSYSEIQVGSGYPSSELGQALRDAVRVAQYKSANNDSANTIIYLRLGGFDTHGDQNTKLPKLISDVSTALVPFTDDLKRLGLWDKSVLYMFSEFGRRNDESDQGTDHGEAGTHLVFGGPVKGGSSLVAGPLPTTTELSTKDVVKTQVDFRNIYREICNWLGYNSDAVFTETYERVNLGIFS